MKTDNSSRIEQGMTCAEIFAEISSRQILALMFHDHLVDLYDFLGLSGFKRWHCHRYKEENEGRRKLKHYYMCHHNKLLKEQMKAPESIIPEDWYKYTQFDVNPQLRKQYLEMSFQAYKDWEEETKDCYGAYAKMLYESGNVSDALKVEELVGDVNKELKDLYKCLLKLKSVNFSQEYVLEIQEYYHKKYK